MFRFLMKLACFVLAAMFCLALVSAAIVPKAGDAGTIEGQIPKDLLIANTGNSHGMFAFDYGVFGEEVPTYNFAMESQSLVYDEKLLRFFEHHFADEGAVLFVLVDLVSLWYEETNDADFQAKNERYLPILGAERMRFRSVFETIMYRYFYAMTCMDRWTDTFFTVDDAGDEDNPQLTRYSREEVGRMRAAHHLMHIQAADGSILPLNETNIAALESLLTLCREKGIRPILLTTPYHAAYTCCVPRAVRDSMAQQVQSVADAYGIAWWDYYDAEPFHGTDAYFNDTDHLSAEGSALFTQMLKARLVAEGYFTEDALS